MTFYCFVVGFLDDSHAIRDTPITYQLYQHIESAKEMGISETEANAYLGQSKLNGRSLIRSFMRSSTIEYYTTNHKRQILKRYDFFFGKKNLKNIL